MMYENDKLIIPEKYRKMSVSELRSEKEKVYTAIKRDHSKGMEKKTEYQREKVTFRF